MNRGNLATRKSVFANRVDRFVNHARGLPIFPAMPVCGAAAIVVATVVGAFGTGAIPIGVRLAFWSGLIGLNLLLWQIWFMVAVPRFGGWNRAAMIGAVAVNLPLPLEIGLFLRLAGVDQPAPMPAAWLEALAISGVILAAILIIQSRRPAPAPTTTIERGGVLAKAGARSPAMLVAIRAEDHYCRVQLSDGRSRLVHHRFGDALREVAALDGARVHRGAWVANAAVRQAERSGRAWRLILTDGSRVPVAASAVADARSRGWLARGQRRAPEGAKT